MTILTQFVMAIVIGRSLPTQFVTLFVIGRLLLTPFVTPVVIGITETVCYSFFDC